MSYDNKEKASEFISNMQNLGRHDIARETAYQFIQHHQCHYVIERGGSVCTLRDKEKIDRNLFFSREPLILREPFNVELTWEIELIKYLLEDFVIHAYFSSMHVREVHAEDAFVSSLRLFEKNIRDGEIFNDELFSSVVDNFYINGNTENVNYHFQALGDLANLYCQSHKDPMTIDIIDFDDHREYYFERSGTVTGINSLLMSTLKQVAKKNSIRYMPRKRPIPFTIEDDEYVLSELQWQREALLKFVFGLYKYSGGIDSPVWRTTP